MIRNRSRFTPNPQDVKSKAYITICQRFTNFEKDWCSVKTLLLWNVLKSLDHRSPVLSLLTNLHCATLTHTLRLIVLDLTSDIPKHFKNHTNTYPNTVKTKDWYHSEQQLVLTQFMRNVHLKKTKKPKNKYTLVTKQLKDKHPANKAKKKKEEFLLQEPLW